MAYAIVQHTSGSGSGTGLNTGKVLGSTPTAGNWLIASVCLQQGAATIQSFCPIDTTNWFLVDDVLLSANSPANTANTENIMRVIARKVVGGDTTTMPAFCTSGSSFFAWTVVEISGGSGTWATDFHSSRNTCNRDSVAAITSPNDTTLVANTLGLAFAAGYNESGAGSFSAGWTADENIINAGNYGSFGVAHQAFSTAGTAFSCTFTKAGTNTNSKAVITVLLTTTQPTTVHIKRHRSWSGGTVAGTPGAVGMGGIPANGNLLVTHLYWSDGTSATPTVGGSWTQYASAVNGSNPIMLGLYRYASSETRNLPALCSAGSQFWAANVFEIGGVIGTFGTDHVSTKTGYQATGATMVTTSDTTTAVNQLATTSYGDHSAVSPVGAPSGADLLISYGTNSQWGSWPSSEQYAASNGTSIQTTWTAVGSTHTQGYIQDIWGGTGASTETGTATMALSGISFSGASVHRETGTGRLALTGISFSATAGRKETGTGGLALNGISYSAVSRRIHVKGTAALALSGVSIVALGINAGTAGGVRQMWTY